MNVSDNDISRYLKMLTLIETEVIDELVSKHLESPEKREWQKELAFRVVEIIHWTKQAELALKISDFMFWWLDRVEILKSLSIEEIATFKSAIWWLNYENENLFETIVKSWLESSNSWARNSVKSWAIFINEEKVEDFNLEVSEKFINDKVFLIRKWKKNFRIIIK